MTLICIRKTLMASPLYLLHIRFDILKKSPPFLFHRVTLLLPWLAHSWPHYSVSVLLIQMERWSSACFTALPVINARVIAARFDLHSRRNGLEVDSRLLAVCNSTAVTRRGMPAGYAAPPSLVLNKPTLIRSRGVCRYIPSPRVASVLELILSNWREVLAHASEHSH